MPQAVAKVEQMSAAVARQWRAVLAEVGDVVKSGVKPGILRLDNIAAARIFAFAKIARERHLLFVRDVLVAEQQHGVFVHAGFDILGLLRRQRLAQIDARDVTEKMRVKLPDRDSHGVSPERGERLIRSVCRKSYSRTSRCQRVAMHGRRQGLRSSCPGRGAASLRRCTKGRSIL